MLQGDVGAEILLPLTAELNALDLMPLAASLVKACLRHNQLSPEMMDKLEQALRDSSAALR